MIKVGVSACVLGQNVRFDGGHKRSHYVTDRLADVFDFVSVCPETGMGMDVPRPTIHLTESTSGVRLTDSRDVSIDHTESLSNFYQKQASRFDELDGYVLAAKSPTCGLFRIKVYGEDGSLMHRKGRGVFADKLTTDFPSLPVEEDGRLNDPDLRESFVTRVYVHNRFRHDVRNAPSVGALMDFHARHKLLVMAYSPQAYQQLGRLVAAASKPQISTCCDQYLSLLMQALRKCATRKKHSNVLMHIQGYFKKVLSGQDKLELTESIERYRKGYVPLMAPVTLLQHHLKHHPNDYLARQVYLAPYPENLGLRA